MLHRSGPSEENPADLVWRLIFFLSLGGQVYSAITGSHRASSRHEDHQQPRFSKPRFSIRCRAACYKGSKSCKVANGLNMCMQLNKTLSSFIPHSTHKLFVNSVHGTTHPAFTTAVCKSGRGVPAHEKEYQGRELCRLQQYTFAWFDLGFSWPEWVAQWAVASMKGSRWPQLAQPCLLSRV